MLKVITTISLAIYMTIYSPAYACIFCGDKETEIKTPSLVANENANRIFESLQNEKTVILAFHSKSCSTCKVQKPELENILKESAYKTSKNYFLNFEENSDLRKKLNVKFPSTIIIFKLGNEIARVTGETDKEKLTNLVQKGF